MLHRIVFALLTVTIAVAISHVDMAYAWRLPDKVYIQRTQHTPRYWRAYGGMDQYGRHSIQRYLATDVVEGDLKEQRLLAVWPKPESDRFCMGLFSADTPPGSLPKDCTKGVHNPTVFIEATVMLSQSPAAQ